MNVQIEESWKQYLQSEFDKCSIEILSFCNIHTLMAISLESSNITHRQNI